MLKMKTLLPYLLLFFSFVSYAQEPKEIKESQIVEASCGQCQYKMKGNSCDLAVKIEGKAYFVDGTTIDSHGDAHASDGFCTTIRKAEVTGKIENDRFIATTFVLLPEKEKSSK
jgi:hypothetical protein